MDRETIPPSAERVAARALVLSAIVCRSAIEGDAGNEEAEAYRGSVLRWLHESELVKEVESDELALLECRLGGMTDRQRIDASWRGEGLVVLGWALQSCGLPVYDRRADPYPIAKALGFRQSPQDTVLAAPRLRSVDKITALADMLLSLHWRLRQYSLDKKPMDFAEFAKTAWFGPLPLAGFRLVAGDLEVRGLPLWEAPEEDWREVLSIARERQQAANWLIGQETIYSEVTCDT